ncbi:carboxylesterase family protein [Streptomyces sp. NPDC101152]|uniref:carboxylesterase family protein n=1 Tax=Streptomyces sp. NPDC101152 TaxID=3366116 RepID=UPI0037F82B26
MTATAPKAPTAPGVRTYDRKGVVSVQPDSGDWLEADGGMGEDRLNLNVWTPEQPTGEALPVAVYIHGGGFEYGANTQITSNASGLAASGRVVAVSINYRLGALGAVSPSQYGGALAEASNLCPQDVIAALTWIRQNIAHFGGDPDNVTVHGHSGGAYAAFGLLGAPAADGLYRRLAWFSAGPPRLQPAWWAEELAHRFVTELGVADNPEKLLGLDTALLVAALHKVTPTDLGARGGRDGKSLGVVLDTGQPGAVLHAHPMDVLASGRHRDVDLLLSFTGDDMGWWVANDLDRFDPHTVTGVLDECAGWRFFPLPCPAGRRRLRPGRPHSGRGPCRVPDGLRLRSARGPRCPGPRRRGRQRPSPGDRARRGRARRARRARCTPWSARSSRAAAPNRPSVTRVSATSCSTSPPASGPGCGPPSPTGPPREASATRPSRPPPTTRRPSTCSRTSTAPEPRPHALVNEWRVRGRAP